MRNSQDGDDAWLFTDDELRNTPSLHDGVTFETSSMVLVSGARFISELGDELMIPALTKYAAVKYFQRFYTLQSMYQHRPPEVAAAAVFLAAKSQECVKRLRDVILSSIRVQTRVPNRPDAEAVAEDSPRYLEEKRKLLYKERAIIRLLNFDLEVDHPYKYIIGLARAFAPDREVQRELIQIGWNFLNDSLRSLIHVQYTEREIATAALLLSSRFSGHELSATSLDGGAARSCFDFYGVDAQRTVDVAERILDVYDY